jgi:hypothetical protein
VLALILLALISDAGSLETSVSSAERCQILMAALAGDDGLLNSEECARRYATHDGMVLVDPVITRTGLPTGSFLAVGTVCGEDFLVVKGAERARASGKKVGVLILEFTPESKWSLHFYATLRIFEPESGSLGSIGCGAERSGLIEKRKTRRRWEVTEASERPQSPAKRKVGRRTKMSVDRGGTAPTVRETPDALR